MQPREILLMQGDFRLQRMRRITTTYFCFRPSSTALSNKPILSAILDVETFPAVATNRQSTRREDRVKKETDCQARENLLVVSRQEPFRFRRIRNLPGLCEQ